MNTIVLLQLLLALTAFSSEAEPQERLRLIHADVLRRNEVNVGIIQSLEGNVEFRQGKTSIFCDVARQFVTANEYALVGNVRIYDVEQSLLADTVMIYEGEQKQVASGHVNSITERDTTFADRITYYGTDDRVISEDNVRIVSPEERTELTAGVALYLRADDYGKAWDNPVWTQFDSLGTAKTTITADTLEMFQKESRTLAKGSVRITQPNVVATCGEAEFWRNEEKIILVHDPLIVQQRQRIRGDTLELYLENSFLNQAIVKGNAVALSDADTLAAGRWENKLTGQNMTFYFSDQELQQAVVENQATSLYHVIEGEEYKGANEVSGDTIVIEFKDGAVIKVTVTSEPDVARGKFIPPN